MATIHVPEEMVVTDNKGGSRAGDGDGDVMTGCVHSQRAIRLARAGATK
jgi:hypothetical protein